MAGTLLVLSMLLVTVFCIVKAFELRRNYLLARDQQQTVMVSQATDEPGQIIVAATVAPLPEQPQLPIAMPQNSRNAPLRFAPLETIPQRLVDQFGDDAIDYHVALQVVAKLVLISREKAFHNGEVPVTRVINELFGERAGSENPRYLALRDTLNDAIKTLQPVPPKSEIVAVAPDGKIVRSDDPPPPIVQSHPLPTPAS